MVTIGNWIWLQNLEALVDVLAWLSCYELAEGEWDAIRFGVDESDADAVPSRWYTHELHGEHEVKFDVGHDKGTNVLQVKVDAPDAIAAKVEVVLALMQQYTLGKGG